MAQSFLGLSSDALKKYRSLIISLVFLILLAIASILTSLFLSSQYNKAFGRYSAMSSAIDLHHDLIIGLQGAADVGATPESRAKSANIAVTTFDQLKKFYPAFVSGGEAQYGYDKLERTANVPAPIDDEDLKNSANLEDKATNLLFKPHENAINGLRNATAATFINNPNIDTLTRPEVTTEVNNWQKGFVLFNTMRDDLQKRAENFDNLNKILTLASIAILLSYFAAVGLSNLRRLVKSDEEIEQARRETDDIMKNVNTGLFLLDKDLNIGNQYSAQLENIIGENKVAGKNLTGLLQNKVSAKDLETTQSFVKQLYNTRVKEKLVNDLNPLRKVMVSDNKNQSRFLDFKFSRVYDQNQIEKILVNVQDVTQQVRLEQRLEQERAQNDLQIEMLTTILNVNPAIINEFIGNTHQNIIKINNILKSPGSQQHELEEKLNGMYRIMHSLKGEASTLKLHSFIQIASDFEEKLKGLQNKGKLSGNDFLPLTIHLDELLNLSNTIDSLGKRINQGMAAAQKPIPTPKAETEPTVIPANSTTTETFAPVATDGQYDTFDVMNDTFVPNPTPAVTVTPSVPPVTGKNQLYQQFADSIALRQNKDVILKAKGFNEIQLPREIDSTLKEIVIQLIRNAVVHGIETPEQRTLAGKPAQGVIKLALLDLSENYKLTIEDDGQGIDYTAVRERAVEMGYNAADVAQWDKSKLTGLLFKSGFSTRTSSDEDAGRGVGMDIIKERVNDLHGHLTLDTQQGQFTRFVIKIPKNPVL